jgi:hypothetical protein
VTAVRTAAVCLALTGIALAGPSFRIGTKLTWRGDAGSSGLANDQRLGQVTMVNYDAAFVGTTVEGVYGPVWNVFSGRIDLCQVSVNSDATLMVELLPMFGLDVMIEPPMGWRVKPYVWGGARSPSYVKSTDAPPPGLLIASATHWCGGLGARFRLTRRIDLFAETQLYSNNLWRNGNPSLQTGAWKSSWNGSMVGGLVGAEIGARFALGK